MAYKHINLLSTFLKLGNWHSSTQLEPLCIVRPLYEDNRFSNSVLFVVRPTSVLL